MSMDIYNTAQTSKFNGVDEEVEEMRWGDERSWKMEGEPFEYKYPLPISLSGFVGIVEI